MTMSPIHWSGCEHLRQYFTIPVAEVPESVRSLLLELAEIQSLLEREERQVLFAGVLQAGKSSLINSLAGVRVLPVRPNRGTGVVTVLRSASSARMTVVKAVAGDREEEPIAAAELYGTILVDLFADQPLTSIDEVRIELDLPLLNNRIVFVDTPGLGEFGGLSTPTEYQLRRSDLVVMVLAADKILSARERATIEMISQLLNGNVVAVINRLDLIDPEDRDEVLEWARTALVGCGNDLVGQPRLFATELGRTSTGGGVDQLRDWLSQVFRIPLGAALAQRARLGILAQHLQVLHGALTVCQAEVADQLRSAQEEYALGLNRQRTTVARQLRVASAGLGGCRQQLVVAGDRLVQRGREATREQLEDAPHELIRISLDSALEAYRAELEETVVRVLSDIPVTAPSLDLSSWVVRAEVRAVTHPVTELGSTLGSLATSVFDGGQAGREVGVQLGSWIGKNVFGVDGREETDRRIESTIRGLLPSLNLEVESYLDRVEALLQAATTYFQNEWEFHSPSVAAAEELEERCGQLVRWCGEFLAAVEEVARQTESDGSPIR